MPWYPADASEPGRIGSVATERSDPVISETVAFIVDVQTPVDFQSHCKVNPIVTAIPILEDRYFWIELSGPWGGSWYFEDGGDTRHGAAANGFVTEDWANPGSNFPSHVDFVHYGIAMPTAAFYGLPIKVCFKGVCQVATAVDVMKHPRVCHSDWECYNMIDLWPATKKALDFPGIYYDAEGTELQVYVGKALFDNGGKSP